MFKIGGENKINIILDKIIVRLVVNYQLCQLRQNPVSKL